MVAVLIGKFPIIRVLYNIIQVSIIIAHALLYALSYTPYAPLPYLIAIQYHTRRGAAPPAYQYYHTGPCSWRSALALPVL